MQNHLANETSPYLLQHADNPVDWFTWGSEALDKAQLEDKPIFLSIGYAACHWCHVMAHETFEDPEIAAILNQHFVSIKVDREERPDLDSIYMSAVVAMTGQGGWPMSVFLTPAGEPFFSGTYFPPTRRHGLPAFRDVLDSIVQAWKNNRSEIAAAGKKVSQHLLSQSDWNAGKEPVMALTLESTAQSLIEGYDWDNGGWGAAPKFPQPMAIEFLLRQASRGNPRAFDTSLHALHAMSQGGLYDIVGGGFHRYSTDSQWLVPHFEKMLYDNAQLAQVYLRAFTLTRRPDLLQVCTDSLDFLLREMRDPEGGFYSSLDADSEGEEGRYYVWTIDEIRQALPETDDFNFFTAAYPLTESGNFENKNIIRRVASDQDLAAHFNLQPEQISPRLTHLTTRLMKSRQSRVRPSTDDKVLTGWNGLALQAFAEAARYLNRGDYLEAARKNARFLLEALHPKDRLLRSWRKGKAHHNAYLEDYASLILGLIELYQSDPDPSWYTSALQLGQEMMDNYRDLGGGFFDTRHDHDKLLMRPKDIQDNATPSGNALAANALLRLSAYSEDADWQQVAEEMLGSIQDDAKRYPTAFAYWLNTLDTAVGPMRQIAVVSPDQLSISDPMLKALWSTYRPRAIAAISRLPLPDGAPNLLQNRPAIYDQTTAYVCENFVCKLPATNPEQLLDQLS